MYKIKLCLGTSGGYGMTVHDQIRLFKKVGFDAFFTMWDENIAEYKALAEEMGMEYQSVHAPFANAAKMWSSDASEAVDELVKCVRDCAKYGIPILVVHPYIGFDKTENPSECGVENFKKVVEEAKSGGVKIAFENVEGEAYLKKLMDAFENYDNVGFCWDSGHEQCYNRGKDMLALYGDRLIATHLNDNLGVRDYNGEITFIDDLHLLPFDGIIDWKNAMEKLEKCGYNGIYTFELNKESKPGRHENDKYAELETERYITECYIRACRAASMRKDK